MDDAIRGGILTEADVPKDICEVIGSSPTERLDHFIHDIVTNSMDKGDILMSEPVAEAMTKIRQFMFERVYKNPVAKSEEGKAEMLMETLYQHFLKHLMICRKNISIFFRGRTEREGRLRLCGSDDGSVCHSGIRGYLHTEILAEIGTR